MDENDALECLSDFKSKKPSEIGEAVDALHRKYGSHEEVAQQLKLSDINISRATLWARHRIFQLPKGILWKVDEGRIKLNQAEEITRLESADEQWLLAVTVVEKNLPATECKRVVNLVLKQNMSIRDALSFVAGVRFEEISPPILLLPVGVDFWFALSKASWEQGMDWQDLCYQMIRQNIEMDTEMDTVSAAAQLQTAAATFQAQMEAIAASVPNQVESAAASFVAQLEDIMAAFPNQLEEGVAPFVAQIEALASALRQAGIEKQVNTPE